MLARTSQHYFEQAYQRNAEVFGPSAGWYEQRKRQVLLASLSAPHYARVFEPACGIGALSRELLPRCDHLLAMDWSHNALRHARQQLSEVTAFAADREPHIEFVAGAVPQDWPQATFDLVVISELLYFLSDVDIEHIAVAAFNSVQATHGEVALIDWRHASADYPGTGPAAQSHFLACWPQQPQIRVRHVEADFILTVIGVSREQ